jgi:nucleoside-diphosphate-sugar epimerase
METHLGRIAIAGATGPTGIHLARELMSRGTAVRVISRSAANLDRSFDGLEDRLSPHLLFAWSARAVIVCHPQRIDSILDLNQPLPLAQWHDPAHYDRVSEKRQRSLP